VADESATIDIPLVDENVRQLVQDQDWKAAIAAIDKALRQEDAPQDRLTYLKGRILHFQGQYDEAIAVFTEFQKRFPNSPWARRARFASGASLVKKGDFRKAELIYRAEAESLLSAERKQVFADIYLEYADAYFDPEDKDVKPDHAQALQFYEKALDAGPKPERRLDVELLVPRCHQLLGETSAAAELYEKFIKAHPDSRQVIEARFRLGECHLANDAPKQARRAWQDLLAIHGKSQSKWIAEASFDLSRTWGVPQPETDVQMNMGVAALTHSLTRFPTHKRAAQAHLDIADSYITQGRYEDAVGQLRKLLADKRYETREEIPRARKQLGQAFLMQERFTDALAAWREYLVKHPSDAAWSDVQRKVIDTEYTIAGGKAESKQYAAARQLLREFLAKYPLDKRSPEILFLFGQMNYEEKKWEAAIDDWRRVVSKFPKTDEASHAQYRIARVMEERLDKLEEALEEYRKVTSGSHEGHAQEAVSRLESKAMTVVTERVFRSDEKPRVMLTTRNIPSVTVRAYKVNMESYFRKMHLAGEVENLDIALIDPDVSFEFEIPDYQDYQQLESAIEVPLPADATRGAMAVTVSSETLEATALVIQSDLDVIVKASRNEAFVFAQDMLTGKPWPGVRLLVSDGRQTFAEAATGDDGVFQATYDRLRDAGDVRVLAIADGHVASNTVGLAGVGVAQGLVDKGYIYTDRPAYRAGQEVRVRGCIRQVVGGFHVVQNQREFDLDVFDPRNRLVWQEEVTLGEFGTFHARFPLPATSPQGEYRIHVHDESKRHYQGTFRVHQYKLEPVRLAVDVGRRVYYRGEEIEGTIRAEYYYGAPLADREITYQLADDRHYTAKTDDRGEVHFKLATREFYEDQVLPFVVKLPQWNVQSTVNFYLATQGFSIALATGRDVFVAGETFEVTVTTKDAEGKPAGQKLRLKVAEVTNVEGKMGERPVEEHAIETAVGDGIARQTLELANGGRYHLRAEGQDRWGNPVSGHLYVLVSDNEDRVRLRILADRHTYKVGDNAEVTLHWREEPALALVTFQADRVLDYRLVPLKTGPNKLPVAMTSQLAPNFELEAAVMVDVRSGLGDTERKNRKARSAPPQRFHEASSPFTVVRDLKVSLSCRRKDDEKGPMKPGEPMEVTVTTTDPQGRPVAAEVSLAMVEQALLSQFEWPMPPIDEFFRTGRREPAVRTTSSITFAYRPATTFINPLLLAEKDRIELARQEAASLQRAFAGDATRQGPIGGGGMGGFFGGPANPPPTPDDDSDGDFDGISDAIQPWETVAGPGSVSAFPANLSLAVSQTQDIWAQGTAGVKDGRSGRILQEPDETAYWNPTIVTDQKGKATVVVDMPPRSTAWTLVAKAITTETLAGETTEDMVARKDFFGQLKLPLAFTAGDRAEVIASVHNDRIAKGSIDVTLRTNIEDRTVEQTKTIEVESKGIVEVPFNVSIERPDESADGKKPAAAAETRIAFRLTIAARDHRESIERSVPLRPYGITAFATTGGSADASTTAWVEAPKTTPFRSPRMQIMVGPTVERSLLDIVLAPAPFCQREVVGISSNIETLGSDLMASLGIQKRLRLGPDSDGLQAQSLDAKIRTTISSLTSSQNNDGGWGWSAGASRSDRYVTARIVWSLSLARQAGYVVPDENYTKSTHYLASQVAATAGSDYESKAILLHALCEAGKSDFSLANRLYRERPSLSTPALLYLALAFVRMDRKETAGELLTLVDRRMGDGDAPSDQAPAAPLACSQSLVETQSLHALAIQAISPQTPKAKELIDWLLAHRNGHRWSPDKATGPAALALCRWFADSRFEGERYKLTIWVNDHQVKILDMDRATATQTIDVPTDLLAEGKQRVRLDLEGRGRYTYQVVLAGFVAAEKLKNTTDAWKVERIYTPARLERDGREIARGFGNVRADTKKFRNPLTQLPMGRRALVELKIERNVATTVPNEHIEYLVVTEPIPSGATVIEQSVRGPFERFEIEPGSITFYIGARRRIGSLHYELYGYLPGEYRAAPTVVRNIHRLEQMAVAESKRLTVLPADAKSTDPYKLTPQELQLLGSLAFQRGDWRRAESLLTELVTDWTLTADAYRHTIEMLLDISLELNKPAQIVRYFEIVYEKWPDKQIPIAKVMRIGVAYHEMGEYERSYLTFRATVEDTFMRESGVAGVLASQGELLRSIDVMQQLLGEYPPEPYVAAAHYSLAQQVYAKAPEAADDARLRDAKVNRVDLIAAAWRMLEGFLTEYALDPAADQGAFSAASALLELENYVEAAAACERYAERYAGSDLLDDFWFMIGYSRFALGQHDDAGKVLRKVVASKPIDKTTGQPKESDNKWPAVYILGQIHHSLGQAADAIREYRSVEDRFPDAKKSIEYFLRKAIRLPEVTTVRPGKPVEVELGFRNVASCDLKVYRIDLMKFALLRQSLGGISRINLAGIEPHQEATIEMGDGKDYCDRTRKLSLDLKDEGAYLVVCRGDSLFASGLVLLTPLEVEVQHDAASREVRATVKDATTGKYVHQADVKVIGVGNSDFVSGVTDRRGLLVAQGIVGSPTVIVRAGTRKYAFHRHEATAVAAAGELSSRTPVQIPANAAPMIAVAGKRGQSVGVIVAGPGAGQMERRIEAALNAPTAFAFQETPLDDVVQIIRRQHRIPVRLDQRALDDVGLGTDTPITFNGRGLSLRSAIELILRQLDLTYQVKNESLVITTPEEAEMELTTVVYPVSDLVRFRDSEGKQWSDYDTLIEMITSTVAPVSWDCVGGPGSIEGMQYQDTDVIILSQTQDVHRHIASLLGKLRSVARTKSPDGEPPLKERPESHSTDGPFGSSGMDMGGMGGMGGFFGGEAAGAPAAGTPFGSVTQQPATSKDAGAGLLKGLQDTKRRLQGRQVDELQRIYNQGMGGMGGSMMGGMF